MKVSSNEVFRVYRYSEYEKWEKQHTQLEVEKHFEQIEKEFKKNEWEKINVEVKDLGHILMNSAPWIKKLACSKTDCKNFYKDECIPCIYENNNSTILEKVLQNYELNKQSAFYRNIEKIKEKIISKEINEDNLFIIILGTPAYVFDGNNRLIAMATDKKLKTLKINCYRGSTLPKIEDGIS